jgi:hypothetical protein
MIAFFPPEERVTTVLREGLDRGRSGTQALFGAEALEMRVILPQLGHATFGRMAFTRVFGRTIVFDHRRGPQRNPCTLGRMDQRRAQHLVRLGDRTVAVDLVQARGTGHRWGGKIPRAIEGQSRIPIQKQPRFAHLAALELPQDACERRPQGRRGHRIESLAPVRVARHPCHAVDGGPMALGPFLVKGQQ